jgi:hypothetical protein
MPPDASTTKTRWPDLMLPASRSAWRAKAGWVLPPARRSGPWVCADHVLGRECVLGGGVVAGPEHLVARLKTGSRFGRPPQQFPEHPYRETQTFGAHDATVSGRGVPQPRRDEDRVPPETRIRLRDDFGLNVILDALTRSISTTTPNSLLIRSRIG